MNKSCLVCNETRLLRKFLCTMSVQRVMSPVQFHMAQSGLAWTSHVSRASTVLPCDRVRVAHAQATSRLHFRVPSACLVFMACYGVATISSLFKIIGLFCKKPYKRDDILQRRPIILRSPLIGATPYVPSVCLVCMACAWVFFPRKCKRHTAPKMRTKMQTGHDLSANGSYEVATISRLPKNIGLFYKRLFYKRAL